MSEVNMGVPEYLVPLIKVLSKPETWKPMEPLSEEDMKVIETWVRSPIFHKLDVIMYNQAQEMMRRAVFAPSAEVLGLAKFAAGYRASFEAFKTLCVLPLTDRGEDGEASDAALGNAEN